MRSCFYLSLRRYYQNPFFLYATVIFFLASIGYAIYGIVLCHNANSEPLDYLLQSLNFSVVAFIFFFFINYEFLYRITASDAAETIKATRHGYQKYYINGILVSVLNLFAYNAMFFMINTVLYFNLGVRNADYLRHIILNLLVNLFLVPLIGILAGTVLSFLRKRIVSYILMVVILLLSTPIFELIATTLYSTVRVNLYPVFEFFSIFPPLLNWAPIASFGYSLLSYRIELIVFWLFFCVLILSIRLLKKKTLAISSAFLCLCICSVSLYAFSRPASKVIMNQDPAQGAVSDVWYYYNQGEKTEKKADFQVLSYDLEIHIQRQFSAKAILRIDRPDLPYYAFTLYHGYQIEKICDEAGNELPFQQDGDHFVIDNQQLRAISQVAVFYSGSASKFYSNEQGIFLPGWFAYYPQPGIQKMFLESKQSFQRILCPKDIVFTVKITSARPIYCNLDETQTGVFQGKTNGLTLMSGFYDTLQYKGFEVIYPYLGTSEFTQTSIKAFIDTYQSDGILNHSSKKIFIMPNTNLSSVYERCCVFSDHMTIRQFLGLPLIFEAQQIAPNKLNLYFTLNTYMESPTDFKTIAEQRARSAADAQADRSQDLYILLSDKMQELGDAYVIDQANTYLADPSDDREGHEFLNALK